MQIGGKNSNCKLQRPARKYKSAIATVGHWKRHFKHWSEKLNLQHLHFAKLNGTRKENDLQSAKCTIEELEDNTA